MWMSYGVSVVGIMEKIDDVILQVDVAMSWRTLE